MTNGKNVDHCDATRLFNFANFASNTFRHNAKSKVVSLRAAKLNPSPKDVDMICYGQYGNGKPHKASHV